MQIHRDHFALPAQRGCTKPILFGCGMPCVADNASVERKSEALQEVVVA